MAKQTPTNLKIQLGNDYKHNRISRAEFDKKMEAWNKKYSKSEAEKHRKLISGKG